MGWIVMPIHKASFEEIPNSRMQGIPRDISGSGSVGNVAFPAVMEMPFFYSLLYWRGFALPRINAVERMSSTHQELIYDYAQRKTVVNLNAEYASE